MAQVQRLRLRLDSLKDKIALADAYLVAVIKTGRPVLGQTVIPGKDAYNAIRWIMLEANAIALALDLWHNGRNG